VLSTALCQWFAAQTTLQPAIVAPVEKPPAPAKRSITFMLRFPNSVRNVGDMALKKNEHMTIDASYLKLENGRYKGAIVIHTWNSAIGDEIQINCTDDWETAAEALTDAENLAKDYLS
jgi:hypothetical protein